MKYLEWLGISQGTRAIGEEAMALIVLYYEPD